MPGEATRQQTDVASPIGGRACHHYLPPHIAVGVRADHQPDHIDAAIRQTEGPAFAAGDHIIVGKDGHAGLKGLKLI
jgi:hypothetical protein